MRYFLMSKDIFKNTEVGMYGKVLFAILSKYANAHGECFPSRKTISKCGHFSVSTYNKYIVKLLQNNFVKKSNKWRENGSQTSNLFSIKRNESRCFPVPSDIFSKGLSSPALCVYMALCMFKDEENYCRVSQHTISDLCQMSLSYVVRAVKELRKAGLLETASQTQLYNNGNYILLYKLCDGKKLRNVIRRRLDSKTIKNRHTVLQRTVIYAIEKRLNRDYLLKITPMQNTHPPYAKYTPPELYLI